MTAISSLGSERRSQSVQGERDRQNALASKVHLMRIRRRLAAHPVQAFGGAISFECLETRAMLAGDPLASGSPVIISEVVADNYQSLTTRIRENRDVLFTGPVQSPDWIELLNVSTAAVDLAGMHLTDDPADPKKWEFPEGTQLAAGGFTIVFASGNDLQDPLLDERGSLHTNFGLSDRGEYLALTDRTGTVVQEFAPAFPPQRADVSYGLPMTERTLVGAGAPREYLVPQSDQLEPAWRSVGYSAADWAEASGEALGFDRGGTDAEAGITIGADVIDRSSVDFSRGSIVVLESAAFTEAGQVTQWSFFSPKTNPITPLLLRADGDEFTITGVGATRLSDGSGAQTFAFDLQSGSDLVGSSGYYFGFKDGDNATDVAGVAEWDRSDTELIRRYNGPLAGSMVVDQRLEGGREFARTYSVQATTQARLEGPFATDLAEEMQDATSLYVRYPFTVDQLDTLRSLTFEVRYDDGFVAYLNGVEIARRNVTGTPRYDGTATANHPLAESNFFEPINVSASRAGLVEGTNVLAIHAFNEHRENSDFVIDARLTGIEIAAADRFGFSPETTPGGLNATVTQGFAPTPQASHARGLYEAPFQLSLTTGDASDAVIYFTRDGSAPRPSNPAAEIYTGAIEIPDTTTLRMASERDGWLPSPIVTLTYIFPQNVPDQNGMHPSVAQDPIWRPQLIEGLKTLPSISLVTPDAISEAQEVGTSIEMIFPDGSTGFQVDAGVEVYGGTAVAFAKQSMRLSFKNAYGPAMLEFDVFDDPDGVATFDQLLLRAGSHDTPFWSGASGAGTYIRNRWASDRQLEMGQPAPRGRFVHVYINGRYWGQYQLMERPNAAFMAANFGGDKEDYDALNAGRVIDGNLDAWNELLEAVDDGYAQLQNYLDVENYADYVLLQFFGGNNVDWRAESNWIATRRREVGAGFQFFAWDSDIMLRTPLDTDITFLGGPGFLLTRNGGVKQYPEFRELLAERAQRYFFDDGMFTADKLREGIDALADQVRLSIMAETARWGSGIYTPATWESGIEWMKQTYASETGPSRAEVVIEQLRQAGLIPLAETPRLEQNGQPLVGNSLRAGTSVVMSTPEGTVYYTTNGSDPRGDVPDVESVSLIDESSLVRVLVPTDGELARNWTLPGFADTNWRQGTNGVGYDTTGELTPQISLDVQPEMNLTNASVYVRIPFEVADPEAFNTLDLGVRYDDGFVAYLNGVEVARRNAPGQLSWNSRAAAPHANVDAIEFERFNLSRVRDLLAVGDNVLSLHGLNTEPGNVDFLLTAVLQGGSVIDPGISPAAVAYTQPVAVASTTSLRARTYWNGEWSPLREASVPAELLPLRVSEVMYHPADPSQAEAAAGISDPDEFEFIEFTNVSNQTIDLRDVQLVQTMAGGVTLGVAFEFRDSAVQQLGPGQQVLVVENLDAFRLRYGDDLPVAGQWRGGLSNNSETITVQVGLQPLQSFTYRDTWHAETDGRGASLEFLDVAASDLDAWNFGDNWGPSPELGGSPGAGKRRACPAIRMATASSIQATWCSCSKPASTRTQCPLIPPLPRATGMATATSPRPTSSTSFNSGTIALARLSLGGVPSSRKLNRVTRCLRNWLRELAGDTRAALVSQSSDVVPLLASPRLLG